MSKLIRVTTISHTYDLVYHRGYVALTAKDASDTIAKENIARYRIHVTKWCSVDDLQKLHEASPKNKTIKRAYAKLLLHTR